MANITNNTVLYNDIILSEGIGRLMSNLLASKLGQVSFRNEVNRKEGETIQIPTRGTLTARTKVAGAAYGVDTPSATLNSFGTLAIEHSTFSLEEPLDVLLRRPRRNEFLDGTLSDAMDVLGAKIDNNFFANYASAGSTVTGTSLTDAKIREGRTTMANNRAPIKGRVLVVSPDIHDLDLLDNTSNPNLNQYDRIGTDAAAKAIADGLIGKVRGFEAYESTEITKTVVSGATTHHCVGFNQGAIGLVNVPLANDTGPGVMTSRKNYQGLELRFRNWYAPLTGLWTYSFDCMIATGITDSRKVVAFDITKS